MGESECVKLPRYVMPDKQRDGRARWLFRRKGFPKVTLPKPDNSKRFWDAYAAALTGKPPKKLAAKVKPTAEHTFGWLCEQYTKFGDFAGNEEITVVDRHRALMGMRREPINPGSELTFEDCPISEFGKQHALTLRDLRKDAPIMANKRLMYLGGMFRWAMGNEKLLKIKIDSDPTAGVKRFKKKKGGWHTWTVEEMQRFMTTYPIGTRERLAFSIMAFTGVRISDACQLGPKHVVGEWIRKVQHKFRKRDGKMIEVPMLPELAAVIAATPGADKGETFLLNALGRPYTIKSAADAFKQWCKAAGLPHCSAHGIRKFSAVEASYNGATDRQLKAMFNWEGSGEVDVYTRMAQRRRLAEKGMKLIIHQPESAPQDASSDSVGQTPQKNDVVSVP
jgi:integrase